MELEGSRDGGTVKLIIMQGLPGSGKSSVVARDYAGLQVVCLDDIRLALGDVFNPALETVVLAHAEIAVRAKLFGGRDVVVDDTHTRAENVLRWLRMGREFGAEVVLHRVRCDVQECIRRREGKAVTREHIERMDRNLARRVVSLDGFDQVITEEG